MIYLKKIPIFSLALSLSPFMFASHVMYSDNYVTFIFSVQLYIKYYSHLYCNVYLVQGVC